MAVPGCTTELARHLGRLAPFGDGNEEPVLVLPRVRVVRADRVGREGAIIRAFVEGEGGGPRLKAMMFRARDGALAAGAAAPRRRAAAPGRASARGGMERVVQRRVYRLRCGRQPDGLHPAGCDANISAISAAHSSSSAVSAGARAARSYQ